MNQTIDLLIESISEINILTGLIYFGWKTCVLYIPPFEYYQGDGKGGKGGRFNFLIQIAYLIHSVTNSTRTAADKRQTTR